MERVVNKISMDLMKPGKPPMVYAVQGEENARVVMLSLFCDGEPWQIPQGTHVAVRYGRVALNGGYYDTLPDGSCAYNYEGNVITVTLAPQMMTSAGMVCAQMELIQEGQKLVTFSFALTVAADPAHGITEAERYLNWEQWLKQELDAYIEKINACGELLGGTMVGPIHMNGQKLTGLSAPLEDTDAVKKGYVDAIVRKAAPRNWLDNSDFSNPVNQREVASGLVTDAYWIDRWKIMNAGRVTFGDGFITVSADAGYPVFLRQHLGSAVKFPCTLSVCTLDKIYSVTFSGYGQRRELSDGLYFTMTKANNYVDIHIPQNMSIPIVSIALYEGEYTADTLPGYRPKGYGVELAECLRYYRRSWTGNISYNGAICLYAVTPYGNMPIVNWEIPMRINPTVTIRSWAQEPEYQAGYIRDWQTGANIPAGVSYISNQGFALSISEGVPLTLNRLHCFHYEASADL